MAMSEQASLGARKLYNSSVLRTSWGEREAEIVEAEMVVANVRRALEVHARREIKESKGEPTLHARSLDAEAIYLLNARKVK